MYKRQDHDQRQEEIILGLAFRSQIQIIFRGSENAAPAGNDTGKDQQRNAVSDAFYIDLLTQPLNQQRTGRKGQNDDNRAEPGGSTLCVQQSALSAEQEVIGDRQSKADSRTYICLLYTSSGDYLEYNSTIKCSSTGRSMSSRTGI